MKKTLILTLAAAASLSAGAAMAQPDVDRRIDNLQRRIEDGIASGQLDRREAWQARSGLHNLIRMQRRYERDGYLSPYERTDLERRADMLSQQIRFDRHDDQRRYGYNNYRPY